MAMRQLVPVREDIDLSAVFAFPTALPGGRGYVRAVFVQSLDGAGTLDGRAGGLGNDNDRRVFALQRALADVVLVGAGTVRVEEYGPIEASDEWSDVRGQRPSTAPIAVVSGDLELDASAPLFADAPADARTIVITCSAAPVHRRAQLAEVADVVVAGEDDVDLPTAIDALAERGYERIVCEGGPTLMAELMETDRLDELCLTLSPLVLAGDAPRITDGPLLPHAVRLGLGEAVEDDDGYLFLLYCRS